jgi:6-phosphogluconolactonase (cycloisomerase 2 family)
MSSSSEVYEGPMKTSRFVLTICASVAILASIGCGSIASGSSQSTNNTPTPTPTPATAASHFIYGIITFETDDGYQGGAISSNGQITPLATLSFTDAGLNQNIVPQVVADPKGRFLYALNVGAQHGFDFNPPGIVELQINRQTGQLTRIPGSPLIFPEGREGQLAIEPSGRLLYQPNAGAFDIYTLDQGSGRLTLASSSTAASIGNLLAISPDGHFLFNANNTAVQVLAINAAGDLAAIGPPTANGSSGGVSVQLAVSADTKFLYVLNEFNMTVFSIGAAGALTPIANTGFASPHEAAGLVATPNGRYIYVSFFDGLTQGFAFDAAAKTLAPIPDATLSNGAFGAALDASGTLAYITENGAISTYSIDSATGALSRLTQAAHPVGDAQTLIAVP